MFPGGIEISPTLTSGRLGHQLRRLAWCGGTLCQGSLRMGGFGGAKVCRQFDGFKKTTWNGYEDLEMVGKKLYESKKAVTVTLCHTTSRIRFVCFLVESQSLFMLRFPEPTGGLSCEVKSDFDPLTSSIRKDHGDLNGVGRRCRAVWMIFFGWFWLCRTLALIGLGWKEGQLSSKGSQPSTAPAVRFEIQKAMQTFPAVLTSRWGPDQWTYFGQDSVQDIFRAPPLSRGESSW